MKRNHEIIKVRLFKYVRNESVVVFVLTEPKWVDGLLDRLKDYRKYISYTFYIT